MVIVNKWIEAFNRHDTEAILDLYADNAIHYSPKLKIKTPASNGFVAGKSALRAWWNEAFSLLPSLHYELTNCIANDNQVVFEYIRTVAHEEPMKIAEFFELKDTKIIASRVYHG